MNEQGWEAHPPYTKDQADSMRKQGQIWGCWFCLYETKSERPYWPAEFMRWIGHKICCPSHWRQYHAE